MSSSATDSYVLPPATPTPSSQISDDIDSLPSSPTHSELDLDEDEQLESDAEREWRESLQQLELLLTMVLVPYVGKYLGRKCAYWGWAKFMQWQWPDISVQITDRKAFRAAGIVGAATI
ncbi:hypothetical protein EJ06DRAFT_554158 [Trichodelitschia bisporula]|uniref:Uncharacterized protein n=1 Tax=Trichodelitschia bisporula TaxID=703511 RepID=A0A6G1I6Y5_9PEZI|nr:hypothetical protein EJ06DRAFT_554158 [Trichodelitschia bisporula]